MTHTPNHALTAIVLAGGDHHDALAKHAHVSCKAHTPIQGKPLASYVVNALNTSKHIQHIYYVGTCPPQLESSVSAVLPAGRRLVDSLALGLGAALSTASVSQESRFMVVTADIPWVTAASFDSLITQAPDADLVYPVVSRQVSERQFPEHARTYARLKEGEFTGGNVVLLKSGIIPALLPQIDRAYKARKNPLALASMLGFKSVLKLLLGVASIAELETQMSQFLAADTKAFISKDASLAADIDKVPQLLSAVIDTSETVSLEGAV